MKARILMVLSAFIITVFLSSCNNNENHRLDVEKYRENAKKSGQKNSITPEQREVSLKKMFPKYDPKKE
ncbi:MAG: hypothetical protein N2484_17400 [Clostridia bacterium]|nr:hypothetical protein [Clostridia bacterium]